MSGTGSDLDRLLVLLVVRLRSAQPGEEGRLLRSLSGTQEEMDRRSSKTVGRARMFWGAVGKLKDMKCWKLACWRSGGRKQVLLV